MRHLPEPGGGQALTGQCDVDKVAPAHRRRLAGRATWTVVVVAVVVALGACGLGSAVGGTGDPEAAARTIGSLPWPPSQPRPTADSLRRWKVTATGPADHTAAFAVTCAWYTAVDGAAGGDSGPAFARLRGALERFHELVLSEFVSDTATAWAAGDHAGLEDFLRLNDCAALLRPAPPAG